MRRVGIVLGLAIGMMVAAPGYGEAAERACVPCTKNCEICGAGPLCIQRCMKNGNHSVRAGVGCGVNWSYQRCK